jgi:MFS family permease
LVSQFGTCIGFLVMATANSLAIVFVARVIDGITAGNLSLAQAYVADVTVPKDRAKSFGIIGIAFGIGFSIGPAITGFLSQYGVHYPVFAAAGLSALSVLATYTLLPSGPPPQRGDAADAGPAGRRLGILDWGAYAAYFRRPELAGLLLQFFVFIFAFSTFTSGFALFCQHRLTWDGKPFGPSEVGWAFTYVGFLGIILQGKLIGPLVARFGEGRLIIAGFASAAVSYVGLGLTAAIPLLVAVARVSSFGNGVLRPVLTSRITQVVGRHEQGVVLGLTQSLSSIAMIIAPAIGTGLIQLDLITEWALVAAVCCAVGLVLALRARPAAPASVVA